MLIKENIPLHDKNWFATGGPARFFAEPTTAQEFQQALAFAHQNNLEMFVLGKGANVLISDAGFDGLVIRPRLETMEVVPFATPFDTIPTGSLRMSGNLESVQVEQNKTNNSKNNFAKTKQLYQPLILSGSSETRVVSKGVASNTNVSYVKAGAGSCLDALIEFCLDNNLLGLEEFSGIPGTVGGAVFINLHYFEFLLDNFLVAADIICKKTGNVTTVDKEWFSFGYNNSALHNHEYYLLNATFQLKQATDLEIAFARGRRTEIIRHRTARYPTHNTCGSFFRNFHTDEVNLKSNGKKMIYVAYYLDKIGVKGQLYSGNAIVSYQHANMIVNQGQATTTDVITVAKKMQQLVKDNFDIIPQPECRLVGFKNYPLL